MERGLGAIFWRDDRCVVQSVCGVEHRLPSQGVPLGRSGILTAPHSAIMMRPCEQQSRLIQMCSASWLRRPAEAARALSRR